VNKKINYKKAQTHPQPVEQLTTTEEGSNIDSIVDYM